VPERLAWRELSTEGEVCRLFSLRAFVHVCLRRLVGARQPGQLVSTGETTSGVVTSSEFLTLGNTDGRGRGWVLGSWGATSSEREGDRERAEAPSGAQLKVSIE
jgi:hypothetical protein